MKKNYRDVFLVILFVMILGVSINVYADDGISCTGVFSPEILSMLEEYIYNPIKWLTPIGLLLLTSFDFSKVVFSGSKDGMNKAKNNFMKRLVAALIIFFAPNIIVLLVDLISNNNITACLPK